MEACSIILKIKEENKIENILSYILESYILLVPALYIIGTFMKKSEKIKDNYIPTLLCVISIVLALLITVSTANFSTWQTSLGEITQGIIQGVLVTGGAVLGSQIAIQKRKADEEKSNLQKNEGKENCICLKL